VKKPKSKTTKARPPEEIAPSSSPYGVDITQSAEDVYTELRRKSLEAEAAGDYSNMHCTTFAMVQDVIKRTIPNDPLNKKYALRGQLSNLFRIRKGRMRICWIASSRLRRVCILFISETLRKEGDANDPYVILQNLVDAGTFDSIFSQFGMRMDRLRGMVSRSKKPQ
jgi:mRNA-degrading endonuclease RelE of RelBE toxin-antitoxin system